MKAPCFDTNVKVEYPLGVKQAVVCSLSSQGSLEVGINNLGSKQSPGFLRLGTCAPPGMSVPWSPTRAGNTHPSSRGAMAEPLTLEAPLPGAPAPMGTAAKKIMMVTIRLQAGFHPKVPMSEWSMATSVIFKSSKCLC